MHSISDWISLVQLYIEDHFRPMSVGSGVLGQMKVPSSIGEEEDKDEEELGRRTPSCFLKQRTNCCVFHTRKIAKHTRPIFYYACNFILRTVQNSNNPSTHNIKKIQKQNQQYLGFSRGHPPQY